MLRTQLPELVTHGFQADGVARGLEAKMADATLQLEYFAFATGQYGGQEVTGLSGERFG